MTAPRPVDAPSRRNVVGRTNGAGRTNGVGRVNGTGLVNGLRVPRRAGTAPVRRPADLRGPRFALLLFGILFLAGAGAFLAVPEEPASGFTLDGHFDDWGTRGVTAFTAATPAADPAVGLKSYAVFDTGAHLMLYAEVDGLLFSDPVGLDTVHAFIDADRDPRTGYRVNGLGAEYRVSVSGGAGAVESSTMFQFSSEDQEDWNEWHSWLNPSVGLAPHSLEIDIPTKRLLGLDDPLVTFVVEANDGDGSSSRAAIGSGQSAVHASLVPTTTLLSVAGEIGTLRVSRAGVGGSTITAVQLEVDGPATATIQGLPATLDAANPQWSLPIIVTPSGAAQAGDSARVRIRDITADAPVTLESQELAAYLFSESTQKRIDGLFADWSDAVPSPGRVPVNPDVDLLEYGTGSDVTTAYFYARVAGTALGGARVPEHAGRYAPPPRDSGGATSGERVRRSAEDRLTVWIDADASPATGDRRSGLGAEWRVEVFGKGGRMTHQQVYLWDADAEWMPVTRTLAAAASGDQVEVGLTLTLRPGARAQIDTRDWRGNADTTVTFPTRGTRGDTEPLPHASAPPSWPGSWISIATDPDEAVADPTVEILEMQRASSAEYLFLRMVVKGIAPVLTNNTWWLLLDVDYAVTVDNDWMVQELPVGSGEVCSYAWDISNTRWGVNGGACDLTDTLTDTDIGSAVRVVAGCVGSSGCVDFALERSDYSGLGVGTDYVTGFADPAEGLDLRGDTTRNPEDTGAPPCDAPFGDCTAALQIPEVPGILAAVSFIVPLVGWRTHVARRRHAQA